MSFKRILEMNFDEEEGKLEQEKKMHLARVLGLEPRQIAVWFQNRRVRSKNKQLERNFLVLKQDYEILKTDYDNLIHENKKLKTEVNSSSFINHDSHWFVCGLYVKESNVSHSLIMGFFLLVKFFC